MGMNAEYLRHIQQAEQAGNTEGVNFLKGQRTVFNAARDAGLVAELPLPEFPKRETKKSRQNSEELFQKLAQEYKNNPTDPEVNTRIWKAFLPEIDNIPTCDWTEEQIGVPIIGVEGEQQPGMMIFLPDLYRGREGLIRLGQRFPTMDSYSVQETTPIVSETRPGGWIKIEASVDAPNRDTTEQQLNDHFESQGRLGQREETYILGGQFSKRVNGRYFDETDTWSRLLGSRHESGVVGASFDSGGSLDVRRDLRPRNHYSDLGGRSEGALPKA